MEITTLSEELVLAVVRGQVPLSALETAGVRFKITGSEVGNDRRIRLDVPSVFVVVPRPGDLAAGILAYRAQPDRLRDWAAFILGASELIDLGPLDNWAEGDQLLNGLWDASFEGDVAPETLRIAQTLSD